jgi:hypothetical protein
LIPAVAIALIQSGKLRKSIVAFLVLLALVDLIVVKDYYNKKINGEFREVAHEILKADQSPKVVASFGWLMQFFFKDVKNAGPVIETNLSDYVRGMKNQAIAMESFWYMDGNKRNYALEPELEEFLNANFILDHNIQKYDAWARHYKSKVEPVLDGKITLSKFEPYIADGMGNLMMFQNGATTSQAQNLAPGNYVLSVKGSSFPEIPIQGQNALIAVKLSNGKALGKISLSATPEVSNHNLEFRVDQTTNASIILEFINDIDLNGKDRNASINEVVLRRLN